jgi:hypothetical protein
MPRMPMVRYGADEITVNEALRLRDSAQKHRTSQPQFECVECGSPVRVHAAGSVRGTAHGEHLERNPECSMSDAYIPAQETS